MLIIHSVIVIPCIDLPAPHFGSLTCANIGMVEHAARSCRALDWSSITNEFFLLLLPALRQASMETNLELPGVQTWIQIFTCSESSLTSERFPWNRCTKQIQGNDFKTQLSNWISFVFALHICISNVTKDVAEEHGVNS